MSEDVHRKDASSSHFTVAVCTLNRLAYLQRPVEALLAQLDELPGGRLLVVDNGSRDGSVEWLNEQIGREPRLRIETESRRGVYHARARAIECAEGAFLVFFDDDAVPAPGCLRALLEQLLASPEIGAVGGAIEPLWEGERPDWLSDRLLREIPVYEIPGDRVEGRFPAHPPSICLGLRINECLRTFVSPARRQSYPLGRRATAATAGIAALVGGEDTDLCEIYSRNGYRVMFSSGVRIRHTVSAERMVPAWFVRKFRSDGHTRIRLLRLGGRPLIGRHSIPMLVAMPALAALRLLSPILRKDRSTLIRCYYAKCAGAWSELLFGPRFAPLPYESG